ncbi:MAG: tRNA (adenosine(37)-N6)-dimethylallyltransferase MiaA [Clostridiales Family XIII bacterium]|jgi:tRNA dimethylallyltransferase|nr:tRNA (adenosine(37)-N6)-dimethylallyltransferase MiaA [Clostridiales Family XIII bacterium]
MNSILVIGPTAVGKTAFAMELAEKHGGEILSADSMQIYKGLSIGTAKPTADEQRRVRHHLIDLVEPEEAFSVAEYRRLAAAALKDMWARGKLPIICGGTGLYVHSLLYEMDFSGSGEDGARRARYMQMAEKEGAGALHAQLAALDPAAAERIHPNNVKRVVRALERIETGVETDGLRPFDNAWKRSDLLDPKIYYLVRERAQLYARIDARVDALMEAGLLGEVRGLKDKGLGTEKIAMLGIGYKELLGYLDGEYDMAEAVRLIKRNTRRYAKRQMTWFSRYPQAEQVDLTGR